MNVCRQRYGLLSSDSLSYSDDDDDEDFEIPRKKINLRRLMKLESRGGRSVPGRTLHMPSYEVLPSSSCTLSKLGQYLIAPLGIDNYNWNLENWIFRIDF